MRRLLADAETPLSLYRKLARDEPGTFLLESAEHGGVWSRYSIVGARSRATLTEQDGEAYWIGSPPVGVPTGGDPTEALNRTLQTLATPRIDGLPPLTGGMVGAITYDAVRRWERVPDTGRDELDLPEIGMLFATDLAVLDHTDGSLLLVANAVNYDATDERVEWAWADAVDRLDRMTAQLAEPADSTVAVIEPTPGDVTSSHTQEQFHDMVERSKEAIRAGEAFQIVVSQRFSLPCPAPSLDVYRALRATNPSPYMYFFRLPHPDGSAYDIVGSSPEALVKVTGRRVITHPIAGSRPRGKTPEDDVRLAEELLADDKERAEHLMLVDLSRNDLQRVCHAGTVDTVEFMTTRRYSHIMHLESTVVGDLAARPVRLRRPRRDLPGGDAERGAQAAGHGAHRRVRGPAPRRVRRRGRLPRLRRRPRHGHRDPHGGHQGRRRARPGRRRHRRRLGPAAGVRGDAAQGGGRHPGGPGGTRYACACGRGRRRGLGLVTAGGS